MIKKTFLLLLISLNFISATEVTTRKIINKTGLNVEMTVELTQLRGIRFYTLEKEKTFEITQLQLNQLYSIDIDISNIEPKDNRSSMTINYMFLEQNPTLYLVIKNGQLLATNSFTRKTWEETLKDRETEMEKENKSVDKKLEPDS